MGAAAARAWWSPPAIPWASPASATSRPRAPGWSPASRRPAATCSLAHLLEQAETALDDLDCIAETARSETDLGLAILEGRADAGLAVEAAAKTLKLDFVPLAEERYDLLMRRRDYFEPPMQRLLAFARGPAMPSGPPRWAATT